VRIEKITSRMDKVVLRGSLVASRWKDAPERGPTTIWRLFLSLECGHGWETFVDLQDYWWRDWFETPLDGKETSNSDPMSGCICGALGGHEWWKHLDPDDVVRAIKMTPAPVPVEVTIWRYQ